jgi:hypothetical protein
LTKKTHDQRPVKEFPRGPHAKELSRRGDEYYVGDRLVGQVMPGDGGWKARWYACVFAGGSWCASSYRTKALAEARVEHEIADLVCWRSA